MDNIYLLMLIALLVLAVADLVVGVSNDAVNFVNSAVGSKAISFKKILIVASLGVFLGALFSSGMMEVARKGIFVPGEFFFDEIMIVFTAVMIADVLLLDFFNTIGLPTSTTVSIVFDLLGATVVMALIKIGASDTLTYADLGNFVNTEKVIEIIIGILLSVAIAFCLGSFIQYLARLIFTFQYEKKMKYFGAIFGGLGLTAISYFIVLKGLKGTPYYENFHALLEGNQLINFLVLFIGLTLLSQLYMMVFKKSILVIVIIAGTFGLALAFAGNDLVNFIGVPLAALSSYEAWAASGASPFTFSMEILADEVVTTPWILMLSGGIMVVTLWFSKKARNVTETEIGLSRDGEGHEKFQPNLLSRMMVRGSTQLMNTLTVFVPKATQAKINARFEKPVIELPRNKSYEMPAFDLIRASINLMVAGVIISIGTSYKLPLSTTYVTFMVAMGSSLADRAWGRESAVYRVAGVLNVIGGWFLTAIIAFVATGILTYLIYIGRGPMIAVLLLLALGLMVRNYLAHRKESIKVTAKRNLKKAEVKTVQGIIRESAEHISNVVSRTNKIYSDMLTGLAKEDIKKLKKSKKGVSKLNEEVEELRDNIFYFIKNLDETSVQGSKFYINLLRYLQDIAQSLEFISKASYKHVNNNHKALRFNQIKDLQEIDQQLDSLLMEIDAIFNKHEFEKIAAVLNKKAELFDLLSRKIEKQIARTRTEESSPKNTTLYFSLLLETKDLVSALMSLMEEYYGNYKKA